MPMRPIDMERRRYRKAGLPLPDHLQPTKPWRLSLVLTPEQIRDRKRAQNRAAQRRFLTRSRP